MNLPPNEAPDATVSPDGPDSLEHGWDEVDRTWDDPESHRRFIALAHSMRRLADASRRYRAVERTSAARAEVARRMLDRIVALAMQDLEVARTPPSDLPRRIVVGLGYVVAIAITVAAAILLLRGRS